IVPCLIVLAAVFVLASPLLLCYLYYPIHDLIGLRNTVYSSPLTVDRYAQVTVGAPRATVVDLLSAPLETCTLTNYPVWALRDEGVRRRYGTNAELRIETLSFSRARKAGDYDMVSVWIGPDQKVIQHERCVTD